MQFVAFNNNDNQFYGHTAQKFTSIHHGHEGHGKLEFLMISLNCSFPGWNDSTGYNLNDFKKELSAQV